MHEAKSAESHIALGHLERLAPNRLRCSSAAWAHLAIGETVLVEQRDGEITFAEVEVGPDERPELACRGSVHALRGLIVRRPPARSGAL